MSAILIHFNHHKFLYKNQTNYQHLRAYLQEDVNQYLQNINSYHGHDAHGIQNDFDLIYVNEEFGDWMVLEHQRDLDLVFMIQSKSKNIVLKLLPKEKMGPQKIKMDMEMQRMGQKLVSQYKHKMLINEAIQEYLEQSFRDIEQRLEKKNQINKQKVQNIRRSMINLPANFKQLKQIKSERVIRVSPSSKSKKNDLETVILNKIHEKMSALIPYICSQVQSNLHLQMKCQSCLTSEIQLHKVINEELRSRLKLLARPQSP